MKNQKDICKKQIKTVNLLFEKNNKIKCKGFKVYKNNSIYQNQEKLRNEMAELRK